jgi:undecaprenyl-diphosphatase
LAPSSGPTSGSARRRLAGIGVLGLAGFLLLTGLVARGATRALDDAMARWFAGHRSEVIIAIFRWVTILGGITAMRLVAIVAGVGWLLMARRWGAGLLLVALPFAVSALFEQLKRAVARPRPMMPGIAFDPTYAFPSGHAMMSTAVCGTIAYLSWRDGLCERRTAALCALIVPLLVGTSRLVLEVHWATDVLAGWSGGLAVAAVAALAAGLSPARAGGETST